MSKETCLYNSFFHTTIRSTKIGNRTENRTPDQPENFMAEPVCQYKFTTIEKFSIGLTITKILNLWLMMSFITTTTIPRYRSRKNKFARSKKGIKHHIKTFCGPNFVICRAFSQIKGIPFQRVHHQLKNPCLGKFCYYRAGYVRSLRVRCSGFH